MDADVFQYWQRMISCRSFLVRKGLDRDSTLFPIARRAIKNTQGYVQTGCNSRLQHDRFLDIPILRGAECYSSACSLSTSAHWYADIKNRNLFAHVRILSGISLEIDARNSMRTLFCCLRALRCDTRVFDCVW